MLKFLFLKLQNICLEIQLQYLKINATAKPFLCRKVRKFNDIRRVFDSMLFLS